MTSSVGTSRNGNSCRPMWFWGGTISRMSPRDTSLRTRRSWPIGEACWPGMPPGPLRTPAAAGPANPVLRFIGLLLPFSLLERDVHAGHRTHVTLLGRVGGSVGCLTSGRDEAPGSHGSTDIHDGDLAVTLHQLPRQEGVDQADDVGG